MGWLIHLRVMSKGIVVINCMGEETRVGGRKRGWEGKRKRVWWERKRVGR